MGESEFIDQATRATTGDFRHVEFARVLFGEPERIFPQASKVEGPLNALLHTASSSPPADLHSALGRSTFPKKFNMNPFVLCLGIQLSSWQLSLKTPKLGHTFIKS